jgi:hypothetical protein
VKIRIKVKIPRLLIAASILTLMALGLMTWSLLQPTPMPVILAMSVGQGFGMLAFALYVFAIIIDLRRDARARRRMFDEGPPSPPPAHHEDETP